MLAASSFFRRCIFTLALLGLAVLLRWPSLEKQIWNLDEGSTFTMAQIVLDGGVLYRDAADNRTPLAPYAKAAILAVVGDWNIRGAHIALALMIGLTAVWIWRIARATNDPRTGVAGAGIFSLLSFVMLTPVDALSAHTGWFLIFFSALGMWGFVAALARGSTILATGAGVAFGLAALAKQPGLLDLGVCLVICGLSVWSNPREWRNLLRVALGLLAGFAGMLAITYFYFTANQAWDDFLRYAWTYNTQLYVPEVPPTERLLAIRIPFELAKNHAPFALALGLLAAGWLLARVLSPLARRETSLPVLPWLILGWCASGLVSTILSGRDFAHYSIQVLPGLSLACGWVLVRIWRVSAQWIRWPRIFSRVVLAAGVGSLLATSYHRATTLDTTESISRDIGLAIRANTAEDERIFVWGYEPELHVFAQRLPSTRFVYAVFLTGLIPWTNLDPLKNTDYAIVPGSWDDFWRDFERKPPAMIADTRGNRGFLKYPLRRQERLWQEIETHYVEVATETARGFGYSLFRRVAPLVPLSTDRPTADDRVRLSGPAQAGPGTVQIEVKAPSGSHAVTLMVNDQAHRRVVVPADRPASLGFFLPVAEDSTGDIHLQAVVETANNGLIGSSAHTLKVLSSSTTQTSVEGPPLLLAGEELVPIEAEAFDRQPIVFWPATGQWQAHAPSRLVYRRPPELAKLEFTFGIRPGAYDDTRPQQTDGVEVLVHFENENGNVTELFRRLVNPAAVPDDRGVLKGRVILPGMEPGRITLTITPGPRNNAAFDWAFWESVSGERSPMKLTFRNEPLPLIAYSANMGLSLMDYAGREVLLAHAPASFAFAQVPGMSELAGEFGLLDSAWQGARKTAGAIFEVIQDAPDGKSVTLFTRTLDPGRIENDRGLQSFRTTVPHVQGGVLRFVTRPAHEVDNSFNYTFWHELVAKDFVTEIPSPNGPIKSAASEAPHGLIVMDEEGRDVLFAHAPSRLSFPLDPGLRRLSGAIGMLTRSYTEGGNTEGATFLIEIESADGSVRELYRRHLNPRDIAADRGAQTFEVELPAEPDSRFVLRTAAPPSGRLDFCWSYWEKLQLKPAQ